MIDLFDFYTGEAALTKCDCFSSFLAVSPLPLLFLFLSLSHSSLSLSLSPLLSVSSSRLPLHGPLSLLLFLCLSLPPPSLFLTALASPGPRGHRRVGNFNLSGSDAEMLVFYGAWISHANMGFSLSVLFFLVFPLYFFMISLFSFSLVFCLFFLDFNFLFIIFVILLYSHLIPSCQLILAGMALFSSFHSFPLILFHVLLFVLCVF